MATPAVTLPTEWDAQGQPIHATAPSGATEWDASGKPLAAPQPGMLEPHGGAMDLLRGAGAGIRDMVAHPIDSLKSAVQPLIDALPSYANGPGGIPIPVPNVQGMQHGQQQLQAIQDHPYYAAGQAVGPAVAGAAFGAAGARFGPTVANAAVDATGRAALLGKTPEAAYESALKPSTTIDAPQRAAIVQTGLQNEIPISKAGSEKIADLIDGLNQQIKAQIASDPNRPIDPNKVATRADMAKARFANQVNAQPDLNAIEASRQQFLAEQGAQSGKAATTPQPTGLLDNRGQPIMTQGVPATPPQPAPPMSATDAQAMKQGTYRVLAGKFGEQGSASVEAQKALARGLKEEIATQFPEIDKLNADESRLLDLQPVLDRAVNRISNHQLIGIGTPVAGAAAKAITGSTGIGAAASVLKAVLDNPNVKSRLAIAVSKANQIPFAQASAKVEAYSAALGAAAGGSASSADSSSPESQTPR
jgi:hypothetical protein